MEEKRFNPEKLDRLNNPERIHNFPPERIIQLTGLKNPEVIIDYGAGTAFFSKPFAQIFTNCNIYACDISEVMLEWMYNNIVAQYQQIHPIKMEDNQVPLQDAIADFLFMVNLHHELDSPEDTLKECYRLLKPSGTIAISDWKKEPMELGPSMEIRYHAEEVKRHLEKSGFIQVEVFTDFPHNYLVLAKK
jgi:ubiquinone/menaquinone biosynthesis C-methylase UbiE